MTNLSTLTIEQLEAIAKSFNLPTEMPREILENVVQALLNQKQNQAQQQQQPTQDAMQNVFEIPAPQARPMASALPRTQGYVSEKLLKFCVDLYKRYDMDVAELEGKDYRFVQSKVDELSNRPSPRQLEIIHETLGELAELGDPIEVDQEVIDSLTGGQGGTASQLIEMLFERRREAQLHGKPSDKQLDDLVKWFFCPDIPWENFNIVQRVVLEIENKEGAWRFMTPEEFKVEIAEKMTMAQAGDFIREHSHLFYEWEKTRIRPWQVQRIRSLEERMSNVQNASIMETAVVDGKVVVMYKKPQRKFHNMGYEPMSETALKQLSIEDADKLIAQMNAELNRPRQSSIPNSSAQDDLETKVYGDPRDDRGGSAQLRAMNKEHQATVDFIFALEARTGTEQEELHESVNELMIQRIGDPVEVANGLREFIEYAIDGKMVTMQGLVQMGSESQTIQRLLQIIDPAQFDNAINGKRERGTGESTAPKQPSKAEAFLASLKK